MKQSTSQTQHLSAAMEAAPRIIAALVVAGSLALAACHTTAGAGKDISAAGKAITNSAQQNTP